jgi:hypothetical protein
MTQQPSNSRFGPLMQKLKAKQGETPVDEFDPTLEEESRPAATVAPARKRPLAKKNNPDYTQTTAYVRVKTYNKMKMKLIEEGGKEYSDLVNELLEEWLASRSSDI